MRAVMLAIAVVLGSLAPAFAQKAEIEAANAKWIELFNKGDFAGVAALYTPDAAAFPPGSPVVRGRDAIGAMWKAMADKVVAGGGTIVKQAERTPAYDNRLVIVAKDLDGYVLEIVE